MASGKVKWFNNAKGYGFILPETGGEDLFVHYSSIQMDGYRTLKAGQSVEFDMQEGPKGYHAVNIRSAEEQTELAPADEPVDAERPAPQPEEPTETPSIEQEALHS
jgi:CspA family cold shock protein